ncbi:hypothetical protein GCM10009662_30230 [Catellatospora coxensis]|uniref:Small secreted domain DUF320 n=1 Tax=Catellatospora coxensis TaxID=310354 RepID=A0A8J3P752_9ACTN|nr:hypothetical protein Cco03nite_29420 [Catellatospora coxensis]
MTRAPTRMLAGSAACTVIGSNVAGLVALAGGSAPPVRSCTADGAGDGGTVVAVTVGGLGAPPAAGPGAGGGAGMISGGTTAIVAATASPRAAQPSTRL